MVLLLHSQQNSSWYLLDWRQGGAKHGSGGKEKNPYPACIHYITFHGSNVSQRCPQDTGHIIKNIYIQFN
jgi:hypothetical protein